MGKSAALAERVVAAAPEGNVLDLGEIPAETGVFVGGQVVLMDGEAGLLPDYGDARTSLAGRLGHDARLKIVLVPVAGRPRSTPPRTRQERAELAARQKAVRARELQGVPIGR